MNQYQRKRVPMSVVPKTVFEAIRVYGHDEDYESKRNGKATNAPPGSSEKVEILARRIAAGEQLWHPQDQDGYDGGEDASKWSIADLKISGPRRKHEVRVYPDPTQQLEPDDDDGYCDMRVI